jgi:hypothetical protein
VNAMRDERRGRYGVDAIAEEEMQREPSKRRMHARSDPRPSKRPI